MRYVISLPEQWAWVTAISSWLLVVFSPAKPLQGWVRGEQIGAVLNIFCV